MDEGMYLEAMNQLKEEYEKNESSIRKIKDELIEFKKDLISCYGMIRLIDNVLEEDDSYDEHPAKIMIEVLRTFLSSKIESVFLLQS
jgi:hypothetical protein